VDEEEEEDDANDDSSQAREQNDLFVEDVNPGPDSIRPPR
jgi:hypothetical protein